MKQLSIGGAGDSGGNGNGAPVGRGAMRGRRQVNVESVRTRPATLNSKKGTSGRVVMLQSNYFRLETHTDWCLYQYRVDFAPDEERTIVRKALLRNHRATLGGYIFDGTILYSSVRFPQDPLEFISVRTEDETRIRITVRLVGDLAQGDAHYIQFFNILMRKCLSHLNLQLVGRNFFDAKAKIIVPAHKLELWPGYVTSIRQHESNILMCCEINHKIMRQETALELLTSCTRGDERMYKKLFTQAITGCVVLTDYNNATYRVDDVDFEVNPKSTFEIRKKGNVTRISYVDYYLQKYQVKIHDLEQPLLVSLTKARERRSGEPEYVYLVPELCRMTGITDEMRGNFTFMRDLGEHTRINPPVRLKRLENFNQRLQREGAVQQDLKLWNMKLAQKLVEFQGRVLPQEKIVQGHDVKYDAGLQTDWTKELRNNPMLVIPALTNWVVMYPTRLQRDAQNFVTAMVRAAQGMRFVIPQPYYHYIPDDRAATYVEALEEVISNKDPRLIMCVVTNNRLDRYASIKKKCCVDRAVPTQVIVAKNLASKSVMSIATKVAIQISCKIGGAPWTVEIPLSGLMVVGFDVCHDTRNKSNSYAALVASLNKPLSRYFSTVAAHASGEELSNYLTASIAKALQKYKEFNEGTLPQRIVIYRDGVGEGDVHTVCTHEVENLNSNLKRMYGDLPVKMTFIIVTKRINTRLFLNGNNPPPGTVADDCVTMPQRYDFFLVSQSVRQGTVTPTSYNVVSDNVGLDPDKLQRLSYKLTHLYFNWSGTVRVPAPCQYAHKLAFLVGQALHKEPSPRLEDLLYFL
jgi:aubergine-like protein